MNDGLKQRWLIVAGAVVIAIGGLMIVMNIGADAPRGISGRAYYYDLNTGELFVAEAGLAPPIDAPSGPLRGTDNHKAGVRAYVFTCGEDSKQDRYVAWIETYPRGSTPPAASDQSATAHPLMRQNNGVLPVVARPNPESPADVRWIGPDTPQGIDIIRNHAAACGGMAPIPCVP